MYIVIGITYSTKLLLEMKELFNMHKLCVVKVRANKERQDAYAEALKKQETQLLATSQSIVYNIDRSWLFSNYMQCK